MAYYVLAELGENPHATPEVREFTTAYVRAINTMTAANNMEGMNGETRAVVMDTLQESTRDAYKELGKLDRPMEVLLMTMDWLATSLIMGAKEDPEADMFDVFMTHSIMVNIGGTIAAYWISVNKDRCPLCEEGWGDDHGLEQRWLGHEDNNEAIMFEDEEGDSDAS